MRNVRTKTLLGNSQAWFWNDPVTNPFGSDLARAHGYHLGSIVSLHLAIDELHEAHLKSLLEPEVMKRYVDAARVREAHRKGQPVHGLAEAEDLLSEFPLRVAGRNAYLSDAHRDIGDDEGADFWAFWSDFGGFPMYDNGFWFYDNQMLTPKESYFRIPYAIIKMFEDETLRLPAAGGHYGPWDQGRLQEELASDEPFQASLLLDADTAERTARSADSSERPTLERDAWLARWRAMAFQPLNWDTTKPNAGQAIARHGFHGRVCAETTLLAGWRQMTKSERDAARAGDFEYLDPSREASS